MSKRKSLKSIEASLNSETFTSANDDEAERSRYRKQLEEQARSSPAARSTTSTTSVGAGPSILESFTAKQLNDHFTSCIKLSAENKINVKNAFDLQLIDYMTLMLKKKDSIMNDFSIASTTLDASAKIYGCRVDSLFQNVVSIANSLSSNKPNAQQGGEEEGEEGEGGDDAGGAGEGRRKKKKNRPKKTVLSEHSLNSINRKVIEKGPWNKFLIDYNDNTMLLSSSLHHNTLGVTMSNNDRLFPSEERRYEPSQQLIRVHLPELPSGSELCPTFAKFSWDIEESAMSFSLENELEHAFDVNREPEPIPELDFDDHFDGGGGGGDNHHDFDDDASEIVGVDKLENAARGVAAAKITDVAQLLSVDTHEYSYFDDKLLELWAGPSHWKLKKSSSDKRRNPEEVQRARQEKLKQKKEFKIEFNRNLKISDKFRPSKDRHSNTLTERTMLQWSTRKVTYLEDCHANPVDLLKFFLHKRLCFDFKALLRNTDLFNATSRMPVTDHNQVSGALDAENPGASSPRAPSPNRPIEDDLPDDVDDGAPDNYYVDDDDHFDGGEIFGDGGEIGGGEEGEGGNSMDMNEYTTGAFIGDNLLPMPNIVNKIDLRIDTRRKIINMKLLKRLVWKILDFERSASNDPEAPPKSMKFGDLYRRLLKDIPANMQQDVTAPVTFFTVLILVNEKSLSMSGESTEEVTIHASTVNKAPLPAMPGPSSATPSTEEVTIHASTVAKAPVPAMPGPSSATPR
ncbi:hypothetical protein M8J76_007846 [Diaphorina citri]|nr:hypothetical protein M8J75_009136 [Diaphorina citri]KAI5713920.1 hypothetical protein M8J76_007846 [Diaphorina citri]